MTGGRSATARAQAAILAVAVTASAAGCDASRPSAPNTARAPGAQPATRAQSRPAATATARPGSRSTSSTTTPGPGDPEPERFAAPHTPLAARLAVARRFADAYMAYQAADLTTPVRAAITHTCTRQFARYLLTHPVLLPPVLLAHPQDLERFRVTSINPGPGPGRQAAVSYVSKQLRSNTGEFLLDFVHRDGRWLISNLHA